LRSPSNQLRIDRAAVSKIGEYGYEPAASQTGIVAPTFSSWSSIRDEECGLRYDPAKAKALLKADATSWTAAASTRRMASSWRSRSSPTWILRLDRLDAGPEHAVGEDRYQDHVDPIASSNFYADVYAGKFQLAYNVET